MSLAKLFDLKGKSALVTGGSRGLGLQMAHALGEAGARIMLSSRKAGDLEEATADLQSAGIDARWIAADCSREEDDSFARIDVDLETLDEGIVEELRLHVHRDSGIVDDDTDRAIRFGCVAAA